MFRIGPTELLVVLAIVIVLFGPTQIPKLTKMFGEGIRNFREGVSGGKESGKAADRPDDGSDKPAGDA